MGFKILFALAVCVPCFALPRPQDSGSSTAITDDDQNAMKSAESALLEQKYQHTLLRVWDTSVNDFFTQDSSPETDDPLSLLSNSTIPSAYADALEPQYGEEFDESDLDELKKIIVGVAGSTQNLNRRDEWSIPYPDGLDENLKSLYRDALKTRLGAGAEITKPVFETAWTRALYDPDISPQTLKVFLEGLEKVGVQELDVGLRAYNLAPNANRVLKAIGSKVIHSAITISHPKFPGMGLEVWFNGAVTVDVIKPGQHWFQNFADITDVKETNMGRVTSSSVKNSLSDLMQKWGSQVQYHLLKR